MTMHQIDYSYYIPEWASIELDLDEDLTREEKEEIALRELGVFNPEIEKIDIEDVRFM